MNIIGIEANGLTGIGNNSTSPACSKSPTLVTSAPIFERDHRYDQISLNNKVTIILMARRGMRMEVPRFGRSSRIPRPEAADTLTDQALHFMQRNHAQKSPFFLQISHYAVPRHLLSEETLAQIRKSHWEPNTRHLPLAMIEDLDTSIGRIVDLMDA